jgi:hypothetical protein
MRRSRRGWRPRPLLAEFDVRPGVVRSHARGERTAGAAGAAGGLRMRRGARGHFGTREGGDRGHAAQEQGRRGCGLAASIELAVSEGGEFLLHVQRYLAAVRSFYMLIFLFLSPSRSEWH